MNVFEEFINNNSISIEKIRILRNLFENNNHLFNSINIDFINSDYFEKLDYYLLQTITSLDENVQIKFLNIKGKKRELFLRLVDNFSKEYYQFPYVNALLDNFNNSKFDNLINTINLEICSFEDLKKISLFLTSKDNELNIQSFEEIKNIESILKNKIEESKNNNDIDQYKNYMLINKCNLTFAESRLLCQKYAYDLDNFHVNNPLIDFLRILKSIAVSKKFEEVENLINSIMIQKNEYPNYQTLLQNLYEDEFNSVLFKVDDKNYSVFDGCKIIDAGTNFNMIIRSNGTYSDSGVELCDYNYWNNNIRDTLYFSTSLISNNYFSNASGLSNEKIIYGFSKIEKNCMAECSMGDDCTIHKRRNSLDVRSIRDEEHIHPNTGDSCGQQFRPFTEMIKHGVMEYQEVTLERFKYENDIEERIQPSYILYYKHDDNYQEDKKIKQFIKAAKSFNIPLVIIDIKKVLVNEKLEMEKLLFDKLSISNIIEVLRRYSNLIYTFCNESNNKCLIEVFGKIDNKFAINNILKNYLLFLDKKNLTKEFYQELFDELMLLNAEKRIIDNGLLVQIKNKYGLKEDYDKYDQIIFGITYKPHKKYEFPPGMWDYGQTSNAYTYLQENNFNLSQEVYRNKYIKEIVKLCKLNNLEITQEMLTFDNHQIHNYIEKINIIRNFNKKIDYNTTEKIFNVLSQDELVSTIQPIINDLLLQEDYYSLDIIKKYINKYNLNDLFNIKYNNQKESNDNLNDDWINDDFFDFNWDIGMDSSIKKIN